MDEQASRLKSWVNGNKKGPHSLDIIPTNKCNLSCLACFQRAPQKKGYFDNEISLNRYKEIVDEAKEMDIKVINILGGGEPFLRRDMIELMQYIKNKDIYGYVVTNATSFNKDLIKRIVEIRWDAVAISLDSPTSEIHNHLRQKEGSFEKIIETIKLINGEKKKQNNKEPKLIINYLITRLNTNLSELVQLCDSLAIDEINLINLLVCSKKGEYLALDKIHEETLLNELKKADRFAKKANIINNFRDILDYINSKNSQGKRKQPDFFDIICLRPWLQMNLTADGFAGLCPLINDESNIANHSLRDIWFGEHFENIRSRFMDGMISEDCRICCAKINDEDLQEKFVKLLEKKKNG